AGPSACGRRARARCSAAASDSTPGRRRRPSPPWWGPGRCARTASPCGSSARTSWPCGLRRCVPCPHGARTLARVPRHPGGESTGGCAEERAFGPVRQRLGELRLQDAHAPQLPAQAALDLAQSGLKLQLLPVLAHGALLLAEPLILDAGPVRVRHARAQLLEVRASGMAVAREALAGARELHGEQGALDLEDRRALETAREAHHLQPRDEPLGRIPLPPAHAVAVVVREDVVEVV